MKSISTLRMLLIAALCFAVVSPCFAAECGDADADGRVTAMDARYVLDATATGRACPVVRCDVDGNGVVGVGDAIMILSMAAGHQVLPACTVVEIDAGSDIQAVVDENPPGTVFIIKPGIHRLQTIRPKDGSYFYGQPDAVLSGARLLTSFSRVGEFWVVGGQTQQGMTQGTCFRDPRTPHLDDTCIHPEDVFIDDVPLQQVTSLAALAPGRWYFDYSADQIYIADEPTGRKVETSVATRAFSGPASDVTIMNLVIEKYANPAQTGAVHPEVGSGIGSGWTIDGCDVRLNHGIGVRTGDYMLLVNSRIHHNGQLGVGGTGRSVTIKDNEIDHNNTQGFSPGWEAGGTKFVLTEQLLVTSNHVHHNMGPGLWTDVDNVNTLYEKNVVEDNTGAGIFHEISWDATIRDNYVARNGFSSSAAWLHNAGILISASPDVEVYRNVVIDNFNGITAIQQARGSGKLGDHVTRNVYVHDNSVRMRTGMTGLAQDIGSDAIFDTLGNRFERNNYFMESTENYFAWKNSRRTVTQWLSYGLDLTGTFAVIPPK